MVLRTLSTCLKAVLLVVAVPVVAFAGSESHLGDAPAKALSRVAVGGRVAVPMEIGLEGAKTLVLERFDVYSPDAVVVENGNTPAARSTHHFFRGTVQGETDSVVFLATEGNRMRGFIHAGDRKYVVGSRAVRRELPQLDPAGERATTENFVREITPVDEVPYDGRTFQCDVEKSPINFAAGPRAVTQSLRAETAALSGSSNARYVLNLAIDTDYELFQTLGSTTAVNNYIAELVAAGSVIYGRDLQTDLRIAYQSAYSTNSDPFTMVPGVSGQGTLDALVELGKAWHNGVGSRAGVKRSAAMLISGKSQQMAGIAFTNWICGGDFAYGSTYVPDGYGGAYGFVGAANYSNSDTIMSPTAYPNNAAAISIYDSEYWTLMAFTHELGHTVQSKHTHCVALTAADKSNYGVSRNYVDECYSSGEGGCYSNGSIGAISANVPAEKGSIMSYCHLTNQYGTGVRLIFGEAGKASQKIVDNMKAALSSATPSMSLITLSASTVSAGSTATASVTNVAGITYSWQVQNATISSGASSNVLTFVPTANPATVKVIATNANGCSVSDYVTVNVLTVPAGPFVKGDMTADGKADLVLRNYSTGANAIWPMNGTTWTGTIVDLPALASSSFRFEGTNDFNSDGRNDILLRNYSTGANAVWVLNGTSLASVADLPALPNTAFAFEGTGDFTSDGRPDVILRNTSTGANAIWVLNGTLLMGIVDLPALPNTAVRFESCGDFNGDGKLDIVLRNYTTGANAIWLMNGTSLLSVVDLPALPNTSYRFDAVADYNADGKPDLVVRNYSTGANAIWLMNGTSLSSVVDLPALPNTSFEFSGPR